MITERRLIKKKMINFKKVASILASGVMLASTISFAAAANLYPKPFTDGAAIVYGSNAASTDMAGAIDIYDQLKTRATGTTDATISGDAKAVETASQPLYLGDYINSTKTTFSKDQLPNVLASGSLTDDDGKELKYDLKIETPNVKVIYGDTPDDLDLPVTYLDIDSSNDYYTLKVIFPTAVNTTKLTDESIKLFGKDYVFTGSTSDLTTTKVVLFEKAVPVKVNSGESVTAEGHTISVAVEDADTASITIDGVTSTGNQGDSKKIGGVDVYVKDVFGPSVAGTERYVELYLNSNKLTLEHAEDVILGSVEIDGTNTTLTTSGGKVSEIKIDIRPKDFDDAIKYLKIGDSITDPVFKTTKLNLVSVNPELEASSRDNILIKPSGDKTASIKFTNKAGKVYDMNFLKPSDTTMNTTYHANGTVLVTEYAYNSTMLGVDNHALVANSTGTVYENDYFITCSGEYTQIWQLTGIKTTATTKEVKVKDQGSGTDTTETISLTSYNGSLSLADGGTAILGVDPASNLTVTVDKGCDYLYTKNGAKINLTRANQYTSSGGTLSSQVIIEEETSYNGGEFKSNNLSTLGKNIILQFAYEKDTRSGKDMELKSTTPGGLLDTDYWTDDVGDYDYYYLTKYGTYAKQTGDTDNQVELWYPEDAMSIGFYIGEVSSEISPGSTGVAGGQIAIVKDSEVSTVASKHLIVVGGSCVNTVAAKILNSDAPLCGADFSTATKVGAGGYIIKTVASPENKDKVAMLVAGYNAADTTNAVKRAMVIDGVKTDVGSEEIFPVVA